MDFGAYIIFSSNLLEIVYINSHYQCLICSKKMLSYPIIKLWLNKILNSVK